MLRNGIHCFRAQSACGNSVLAAQLPSMGSTSVDLISAVSHNQHKELTSIEYSDRCSSPPNTFVRIVKTVKGLQYFSNCLLLRKICLLVYTYACRGLMEVP